MENDLVTMEILGTKSLTQRHCLGVGVCVCVSAPPMCVYSWGWRRYSSCLSDTL